jgi:glycerate kinase
MIKNILIAMDSFKGSISGQTANRIIADVFAGYLPAGNIHQIMLADGGEGSLDALAGILDDMKIISADSVDPAGRSIASCFGYRESDREAFIEIAKTDALPMVAPGKFSLLDLSSSGVGILVKKALELNADRINLFLGGSATVDAGAGMLQELGVRYSADGSILEYRGCGRTVTEADYADFSALDSRIGSTEFVGYCDVTNPLAGPDGAALVFGPQKGGQEAELKALERKMERIGRMYPGADTKMLRGGAAGGLGYAVATALGGRLAGGAEYFLELQNIRNELDHADLVITGEGRIDSQSFDGKGPGLIADMASRRGIPVIGICGSYDCEMKVSGSCFTSVFSVLSHCCSVDEAVSVKSASDNLRSLTENLASLLFSVKNP